MTRSESATPLVLVSNRGPVTFRVGDTGALLARRGGGGLVTALAGMARHHDVTWIAHAMTDADVEAAKAAPGGMIEEVSRTGARYSLRFVGEPDATFELAYLRFSNPLLWFLMHRLYGYGSGPTIDRSTHASWRAYCAVNQRLAHAVAEHVRDIHGRTGITPAVMVHDYQLLMVPGMVRQLVPEAFVELFLHVPWPTTSAWAPLPQEWMATIINSMLSCDLLGFQTAQDTRQFQQTCAQLDLGDAVGNAVNPTAKPHGRRVEVRAYPISVAVDEFDEYVERADVKRLRERLARLRPAGGSLIVRVDRTDPSKNVVRGVQSFGLMLHEHPELRGKVSMFCQLDPSRQEISSYAQYSAAALAAVDDLNATFGTGSWQPVYANVEPGFNLAIAAYAEYDVLFVNPIADGMNLVCKEGPLVNHRDGVLVLSERAGAFAQLGPYAIGVNPFDVACQADALHQAILMPTDIRQARAEALRAHVIEHDIRAWVQQQVDDVNRLRIDRELA